MPQSLSFEYTAEKFENGLIGRTMEKHGCVIVGFSGGADSSCLLRLMIPWCRKKQIRLAAVHVNHMIRGDEADSDEMFCRRTCDSLGIELFVRRADVPSYANEHGLGIEEAARKIRYSVFDEISEILTGSPNGAAIATAHNADDNLETVIFNMLRGAGTHGLGGIPPVRDGRFVRPLIRDSSEYIRQWCRDNGVEYVTDSTNANTDYTRNHIRLNIVPELRRICPSPEKSASRLTSLLRADDDFIESECRKYFTPGDTSVSRRVLENMHPSPASRLLRHLYSAAASGSSSLEEVHIAKILSCLTETEGEFSLSLPGSIKFRADRHTVSFDQPDSGFDAEEITEFTYPDDGDVYENGLYRVVFSHYPHKNHTPDSIENNIDENIYKLSTQAVLCFDKINGTLKIKKREGGELYLFGGMNRKVKKLLGDKKLTSYEKSHIPIISDDDGVVWIPSFPPRDGLSALRKPDGNILVITAERIG